MAIFEGARDHDSPGIRVERLPPRQGLAPWWVRKRRHQCGPAESFIAGMVLGMVLAICFLAVLGNGHG